MPDTFAITILFIIVCTVMGAFIKGRTKDICLRDFDGFPVTLEKKDEKRVWGRLRVENSALEIVYSEPYMDEKERQIETSYILYKSEFGQIKALIRYADDLSPELAAAREGALERTRHPRWYSRLRRKARNFFGTVRDSLLEIVSLFVGRIRSLTPAGSILRGQDKYVSQMQQQAVTALHASYEPVLERYIGRKVVLSLMSAGKKTEYSGILRDYTTEFIEIMDTQYTVIRGESAGGDCKQTPRRADLVVPRALATVRHSGE